MKQKILRDALLLFILLQGVVMAFRLANHRADFALVHALGCLASLGLFLLLSRATPERQLRLVTHGTAAVASVNLFALSSLAGGTHAPAVWIMTQVPMLVALGLGPAAALGWWALVVALLTLIWRLGEATRPDWPLPGRELLLNQGAMAAALALLGLSIRRSLGQGLEQLKERDRRLIEQSVELVATRDQALEAARARTRFLAVMSHELRTPLNAVIGSAELLRGSPLSGEQLEDVRVITGASKALLGVIGDILDFSKLESGQEAPARRPFSPRACAESACSLVATQAKSRGLLLDLDLDPRLPGAALGDAEKLQQVLVNLLGNAVKFTDKGGVRLGVRVTEAGVCFEVHDSGPGISAEDQRRIFAAFAQVEAPGRPRHGGVGLGLAISRALVERMGGRLTVESEPGRGATFSFTLDLPPAPAEPAAAAAAQARPLRVLLAEDNPVNRRVVARMLGKLGHHVEAVEDGLQALAAVDAGDFEALVLDINMPNLDGLEVARALAQRPAGRPWIIGLTANALAGDREQCLEAGMDDFLTKPVELEALGEALRRAAGRCSS